jgi:hypothetical protein
MGTEAAGAARLQTCRRGRGAQAGRRYARHAEVRRTLSCDGRHGLTSNIRACRASKRVEVSLPGRGRTIPLRLLHPQATIRPVECASNIGRFILRSPIMRRLMSTAKTTVLPANDRSACKKGLALCGAIRRQPRVDSCHSGNQMPTVARLDDRPRQTGDFQTPQEEPEPCRDAVVSRWVSTCELLPVASSSGCQNCDRGGGQRRRLTS